MTPDLQARLQSAFEAMAERYVHQTFDDLMRRIFAAAATCREARGISSPSSGVAPQEPADYSPVRNRRRGYGAGGLRALWHARGGKPGPGRSARCVSARGGGGDPRRDRCAEVGAVAADQLADIREQARAAEVFDQHAEAASKDAMILFETYVPRLPTRLHRRFVASIRRRSPTARLPGGSEDRDRLFRSPRADLGQTAPDRRRCPGGCEMPRNVKTQTLRIALAVRGSTCPGSGRR
jgi:hypothetical protein